MDLLELIVDEGNRAARRSTVLRECLAKGLVTQPEEVQSVSLEVQVINRCRREAEALLELVP